MTTANAQLLTALELIEAIASGSRTANSLPHIARIARAAIVSASCGQTSSRELVVPLKAQPPSTWGLLS